MSARGNANPAVVVEELEIEAYPSLDLVLIRPDRRRLLPQYLVAYLNLPATQAALAGHRTTAVLPRLSLDAIASLPIRLPSLQRQGTIAALATDARREHEILEALADRRLHLLNELMRRAVGSEDLARSVRRRAQDHSEMETTR